MTNGFSSRGISGLLRRLGVLSVLMAAVIGAGFWPPACSGLGLAASIGLYVTTRPKDHAPFRYALGPAVIGPDWLGFVWVAMFAALPVWAHESGQPPHPSAYLLWPMAAAGLVFPYIGWSSESFGLTPEDGGLTLRRRLRQWRFKQGEIVAIKPWRGELPRWVRVLAPGLAGTFPATVGALMLARARNGLMIHLYDGRTILIETDALTPGREALQKALHRRDAA